MSLFIYALFGFFVAFIATGYFHGIHHEVVWSVGTFEGLDGVAQVHIGHYKDLMPVFDTVKKGAIDNNLISVEDSKLVANFGLYYDDPHVVKDSSKWRSRGGIVLSKASAAKAVDNEVYKVVHVPAQRALMTEFPLVSQLSIFVGLFKVYPAMSAFEEKTKENFGSIIEIHDYANKKIRYIAMEKTSPSSSF